MAAYIRKNSDTVESFSFNVRTKTFEGREKNPGEHGETIYIRLALFNERSGPHSATRMKFLLSSSLCYHRRNSHFLCILSNLPCGVMYEYTRLTDQENGNSAARAVHWRGCLRSYNGNCNENAILKLNFALSLLRLYHAGHVVQNRRSALSLAWPSGFDVKAKNERFTAASSRCLQNLKYENLTSSFARIRQNIAPKSVTHVQHDYFPSFNQSNY